MRKLFTSAVVVLTIFWAVGLAAFVPTAQAVALTSGDLIKASLPAVYYYGADAKRYVFPDVKTYMTWYSDFSTVKTITDAELAMISIGGNVTYRPGVKMLKINTDPRVYAVDKGGVLRWVKTEAVAACLYGSSWGSMVQDVSDAFFVNYTTGAEINDCAAYNKTTVMASAPTINVDKGLAGGAASGFSVSLAADNPSGATLPKSATSVEVLKFNLSGSGTVTSLTFKSEGVGNTADIANSYLYEGDKRWSSGKTFNSTTKEATFNVTMPLSTRVLSLVIDVAGPTIATAGDEHAFKLLAINGEAIGGVMGNTFTIGSQSVSNITLDPGTVPSNPQVGAKGAEIANFKLTGGVNDTIVNRITLTQLGSINSDELTNFVLKQAGNKVAEVSAISEGDKIILVFTPPFSLLSGAVKTYTLYADVAGRPGRTVKTYLDENTDLEVIDSLYGFGSTVTNNWTAALPLPSGMQVTTEGGEITVAFNGPVAGDASKGAQDAVLYEFAMTSVAPVDVRNTYLSINAVTPGAVLRGDLVGGNLAGCADGADATANGTYLFTDIKLKDADSGQVLAGPVNMNIGDCVAASGVLTLTDDWQLDGTRNLAITVDISRNEDGAGDFFGNSYAVTLGNATNIFVGGADIKYQDSNDYVAASDIVPNLPILGNQQQILASNLSVAVSTYLSDNLHVKGVTDAASVAFTLSAGSDSDIKLRKLIIDVVADDGGVAGIYGEALDPLANNIVSAAKLWEVTGSTYTLLSGPKSVQSTLIVPAPGSEILTFDNLNKVIPAGDSIMLVVSLDASKSYVAYPANVAFQIKTAANIDAYDKDDNAVTPALIFTAPQTYVNDDVGAGQEVASTIINSGLFSLTSDIANSDYKERLVQMGTADNKILRAKASGTDEDFKITDLRVSVIGSAPNNVTAIKITYPTNAAQTTFDSKTSSIVNIGAPFGYVADFTGMTWFVPDGVDSYASLAATVNTDTNGAVSGTAADFSLQMQIDTALLPTDDMGVTATAPVTKALGLSSGVFANNAAGVDAFSNMLHARKTVLTIDNCAADGSGPCPDLAGGSGANASKSYWMDIKITNSNGKEAKINALTLQVSSSDKGATNWVCGLPDLDLVTPGMQQIQIKDKDNVTTGLVALTTGAGACVAGPDNETYLVTLLAPLTIGPGATKIYRVELDASAASTASIPGADTLRISVVSTDTQATVPAGASLQWDDGLGGGVSNNNGWKVELLPADGPSWNFGT